MEYRHLGKSGLEVSELSFGSWITFGSSLDYEGIKKCLRTAVDYGVNFFDNAEAYGQGVSELLMGEALRDYRREELIISTKLFWGGNKPNQIGLSRKHLIEGARNSLRRLQVDYVDLLFCHRPDPRTPIEETVRAMDYLVRSGLVLYWGTSEWRAADIATAYRIAKEISATPPTMEQPEYNMFKRERVEIEYTPLYAQHGMGITTWSPLDCGILTGKYNQGIPSNSRLEQHQELRARLTKEKIAKVKALANVAKELDCTLPELAIAWCLKNPHVSSVITGATNPRQIEDNMQASMVKHNLSDELMQTIENILQS
jgi:voltage-dependent potassium channel beta subunit